MTAREDRSAPPHPAPSGARAPSRRPLVLACGAVAAVALATRLAMAWAIPLAAGSADANCAPDESEHLAFARALSEGRAPTWPDGTTSIYGAFLPTPYLAHAATLRALGGAGELTRFPPREAWARGYGAARLGSVLLGALAAVGLALAAAAWTGSAGAALAAGLVAALVPQHVFVGAYVNADAYALAAVMLHAWAVARWAARGEGGEGAALVGATAGLVLAGKLSAWFPMPVTALWLAWAAWRRRVPARAAVGAGEGTPGPGPAGEARAPLVRSAVAAALVAGPVIAWNAVRNGGDPLGLARYRRFLVEVWHGKDGRALPDAWRGFVDLLPRSTFGVLRNMDLALPDGWFTAAGLLLAVGLAAAAARLPRASPSARRGALWLAGVAALNLALVVYNCWFVDFSPQGRYVLGAALLLGGVAAWSPAAWLPRRVRWAWPLGCVGFLVGAAVQAQVLVFKNPCLR